ncbi:MAG: DUF4837 family protein [Bacteroidetes bacterium]|nr:DUF4837 family protein [Bacteroidota bacterium]
MRTGVASTWFGLLSLLFFASCGSQEGARSPLTGKVGAAGEIVVVAEQSVWDGMIGDSLRAVFDAPFPVLPQYEPWFDLVHLEPESFDRFWKPHRNIIHIEIADRVDTQTPSVQFFKEKYSHDQIFVVAKAKSIEGLAMQISEQAQELISVFHRAEVERFADLIALDDQEVIRSELIDLAGLELTIPRDARWAKKNDQFLWIDRQLTRMKGGDNHDVQQGFFVYREPYVSDEQFSMQSRLQARNRALREFVEGPTPQSYMTTEMRYVPTYEEGVFKGQFASELRGLWRIEGDFMGGPFYSLTLYHEESGELVTVEGYAYAPFFEKREYMREVEAVVRSLTWTQPMPNLP